MVMDCLYQVIIIIVHANAGPSPGQLELHIEIHYCYYIHMFYTVSCMPRLHERVYAFYVYIDLCVCVCACSVWVCVCKYMCLCVYMCVSSPLIENNNTYQPLPCIHRVLIVIYWHVSQTHTSSPLCCVSWLHDPSWLHYNSSPSHNRPTWRGEAPGRSVRGEPTVTFVALM